MKEIRYVDLARQAKANGNDHIMWLMIKNQARVMRKLHAQQKAAVSAAAK